MAVSPYINHFLQPDSIIPDLANPQSLNRYSYVTNRPVNFNDPTGHEGECANDPTCSQLLVTFVGAAIDMESPKGDTRPRDVTIFGIKIYTAGYYTGIGPAKVSDAEMEGVRGEIVDDKHVKVGLGLRNKPCDEACIKAMDQADPNVATIAMTTRISMRLDVCVKHGCTRTDMFMVALLAADERITPNALNLAFRNKEYDSDNELVTLDWAKYLKGSDWPRWWDRRKNKDLIKLFSENVKGSNPQAYSETEWDYIGGLAQ